ncbi:MAG TPA: four helix bundle protein [Phycisphaerae bacterium]|nr:four helix bundle protein [Phycisphaerae bacterium]
MSDGAPQFPFESLEVYQLARTFRRRVYKLAECLPDVERFNLAAQIRSAARSLTNNIAEGSGRYGFRDRVKFMHQARGSLTELMDDIVICEDQGYAQPDHLATLRPGAVHLYRAISAYVRYLREKRTGTEKPKPAGAAAEPEAPAR